jgi:HTH-type transcriptional regulator, sugar sensing transcriptional regulator
MDERALGSLRTLGLSQYEARLYLGLLTAGPQNGNELSKTAGVPSSKVYATLNKLAGLGIVAQVNSTEGAEYVCIPPEALLERLRSKYEEPLTYLEGALPDLAGERVDPTILTLASLPMILDEARKIVDRAQHRVRLSIWGESLTALAATLESASARGVLVSAMIYGEGSLRSGSWLQHGHADIVSERIGGRMLTMVADGNQALIAHLPFGGGPLGIRTENPVLCLMAEEYLHHDFVLEKAKTNVGFEAWERWWRSDPTLRDMILGRLLSHEMYSGEAEVEEPASPSS